MAAISNARMTFPSALSSRSPWNLVKVSQPWGLAGGEPGAVGKNWLLPDGD